MANPKLYQFDLDPAARPEHATIDERWYPGVRDYWERSTSSRVFNPLSGVRAIVVHATAGSSSAGAVSVMAAGRASFHWLVPDENEAEHERFAWACAPESLAAWHVRNAVSHPDLWEGRKRINRWSLGIEVVNRQTPNDAFSDWQIETTARIVRYCWFKYPNLRHVVSHAKLDPTRRTDPGTGFPWEQFRERVVAGEPALWDASELGAADAVASAEASGCCVG